MAKNCSLLQIPKVVDRDLITGLFKYFFHKLQVLRMHLILVLNNFVFERDIQCDLITLIYYRPVAWGAFTNMHRDHARNIRQVFVQPIDQSLLSVLHVRLGPKNNNMRKHHTQ
jgi:hypothetical protein